MRKLCESDVSETSSQESKRRCDGVNEPEQRLPAAFDQAEIIKPTASKNLLDDREDESSRGTEETRRTDGEAAGPYIGRAGGQPSDPQTAPDQHIIVSGIVGE